MNNNYSLSDAAMHLLKVHFLAEHRNEILELKNEISELRSELGVFLNTGQQLPNDEQPVHTAVILERFGICNSTLKKYRIKGVIPYSRIGRKFLYKISDVEAALSRKGRLG